MKPREVYDMAFKNASYNSHRWDEPRYNFVMDELARREFSSLVEVGPGRGALRARILGEYPDTEYRCLDLANYIGGGVEVDEVDLEDAEQVHEALMLPYGPGRREPHDVLICTDVLEHLDEMSAGNVLLDAHHAAQAMILTVAHHEEVMRGEVLHKIVQPPEWWRERLTAIRRWRVTRDEPTVKANGKVMQTGFVLERAQP